MKRLFTGITVFVLALAAAGVMSAQSDPRVGTWKLDAEKSKSDALPRQSETRTHQASGDTITMHAEVVNADGSKQSYGYTGKADGKDSPYTGQPPGGAEMISVKRMGNAFTAESKKAGKALFTTTVKFSNDGKVMTLTTKGKTATGQSANGVRVYNKQ